MVKKGTAIQNERGLRLAATMHQHELRPTFVRRQMETHVIDVLETRCRRAVRREVPKVLHEYACFEDSLLGKSASSAGWIVHRWGLPKTDLSTKRGVDEVYRSIVEDLRRGSIALLWVSLPCGPWSPLHRLISPKWTTAQRDKYQSRRNHDRSGSLACLHLLADLLDRLGTHQKLVVAFEWPLHSDGWRFMPRRLAKHFPHTSEFDGCQYGLKSSSGLPVRKSWRVLHNCESLGKVLARKCPGDHAHQQQIRGKEAEKT